MRSDLLEVGGKVTNVERRRLRLLVAIASYGTRNLAFLKQSIRTYRNMRLDVHIVVFSEAPKDLDSGVEVRVGLPAKNPWSLPFAHKALFTESLEQYDLFAYSEDDMEVTAKNIEAFLRATPQLAPDEIAGFLRYEVDRSGDRFLPEAHGGAHWKPESVRRRGDYTIAAFSNEHAAFYLLTQAQLKRAIASGGFLRGPCQGRYDMLCTAATDPYTNCGMRKVICISVLEDFLIHHAPNQYAGRLGLPLSSFVVQIQTLLDIGRESHPVCRLYRVEPRALQAKWSKSYYESPCEELLTMVPKESRAVLSVGCGWGASEAVLCRRGISVTALPLDSVIGAAAARCGIEVVFASLMEGLNKLGGKQFDAVLMTDLLHLLPNPSCVLDQCAQLLRPGGVLVMTGPNFEYLPVLTRRILGTGEYRKLRFFSQSGIHPLSIVQINRWLRIAGLECERLVWRHPEANGSLSGSVVEPRGLARLLQRAWLLVRQAGLAWDMRNQNSECRPAQSFRIWSRPGRLLAQNWIVRAARQT